jgi:group I intron endonuclease
VKLQRSWNKHGEDAFIFEIVEHVNKAQLIEREQHWIDVMDTANSVFGFNVAPRAGTSLGRKHPPEVLAKLKGPKSASHRLAISKSAKQRCSDLTERQRLVAFNAARTGKPAPWVIESNKRRRGKKRSPMSEITKRKLRSRKFTEETRLKMSIAAKQRTDRQRNNSGRFVTMQT